MTPAETTTILRQFNEWRRGADVPQPKPREICEAIDAAVEMIERLEAVEKERDWNAERLEDAIEELTALRAKIEAMEKQEPVAFALYSGWARKAVYLSEIEACEQRDRRQLTADLGGSLEAYRVVPLYALPGTQTQPTPSAPGVPLALLIAVADLAAQMEIVARSGFVDTPDDKDSCAAFCVAEGAWLELMRCVESLASALAAAPEAKP